MGEELHVMLARICVLIWEVPLWEIFKAFFDILLPKTKPIFVGIIYRPPNSINFLKCSYRHLDDINLDNEIFLLGDFNINLLHNGKYILKEKQAMQNRIPSTSLLSQYKLFCQRYSLEQIIKHATRTTCSSSTLIVIFLQILGKNLTKWCYRYRYFWSSVNLFDAETP